MSLRAFADDLRQKRYLIAYLLFLSILAFGYSLFNFSLSIDEELQGQYPFATIDWVAQGHWGMYLLSRFLFPNPVVPFLPLLIAVFFTAAAYFVTIHVLSARRSVADYLAAPIFIACPIFYYTYNYNGLCYGAGLALFCSALAVWILVSRPRGGIAAALFMAFAIAVYQVFVFWLAALFCFYLVSRILHEKEPKPGFYFSEALRLISWLIFAAAIYYLVDRVFHLFYGVGSSAYLKNYLQFQWAGDYFIRTFSAAAKSISFYYGGAVSAYGYSLPALAPALGLSLLIVSFWLLRVRTGARLLGMAFLLTAMILPFTFNLISGGTMPARTLIALPLVFSALIFLAYVFSPKWPRYFLMVLAAAASFQFIALDNRLAFSDLLSWQADRELALRIQKSIDEVAGQLPSTGSESARPLEIVGCLLRKPTPLLIQHETVGASFFSWDGGDIDRMIAFMKTMGLSDYRMASVVQRRSVVADVQKMPVWPAPGSAKVIRGVIVVKLGDYTPFQLARLQQPAQAAQA